MLCSILSSSDDFSVATPDETAGKDTEFSLVVSLRNKQNYILNKFCLCKRNQLMNNL